MTWWSASKLWNQKLQIVQHANLSWKIMAISGRVLMLVTKSLSATLSKLRLFGTPSNYQSVAHLIHSDHEIAIMHTHHKKTLLNLQKLPKSNPDIFIMVFAGSLVVEAHIHINQLGLFGMISCIPGHILQKVAPNKLKSEPDSSPYWFINIKRMWLLYRLPSPISLLKNTPSKDTYKTLVKNRVTEHWRRRNQLEAFKEFSSTLQARVLLHFHTSFSIDN